jgi:hypothetical protein
MVEFYEIRHRGLVIEGDVDVIIFNAIASTILKWTFRLLRWVQNLYQSAFDYEG